MSTEPDKQRYATWLREAEERETEKDMRIAELEKWQRDMVEIQASGGRLDGYRELASKCCALEEQRDAVRVDLARLRGELEAERAVWVYLTKAVAIATAPQMSRRARIKAANVLLDEVDAVRAALGEVTEHEKL